ncbi:MAG: thiamine phosphate synthase [Acidobacteria bacterium]|nr:thiamine phosphate synthase [Acidobacteriota bacterium]MCI0720415.1 thiamine phosphate synthase [Acidobacteriota bacterium]
MPLAYYITDRQSCSLPIIQQIRQAIDTSIDLIQIREKDLATRSLLELAQAARDCAKGSRSKILINDRLDIALAAGLDGVQLGHHSIPAGTLRERLAEKDFLIGVSVHSLDEFLQAESQGASFVTLGPVFATPSKAAYGPPLGLEVLRRVCQRATIPVFALGGIELQNYQACLASGAAGIAAIRLFQTSEAALKEVVNAIHN